MYIYIYLLISLFSGWPSYVHVLRFAVPNRKHSEPFNRNIHVMHVFLNFCVRIFALPHQCALQLCAPFPWYLLQILYSHLGIALSHHKSIMEQGRERRRNEEIPTSIKAHWLRLSSTCVLSVLGDRWYLIAVLHSSPLFPCFVHCGFDTLPNSSLFTYSWWSSFCSTACPGLCNLTAIRLQVFLAVFCPPDLSYVHRWRYPECDPTSLKSHPIPQQT